MSASWVSLLIGFVIWSVAFVAIYGLQALGCYWSWDPALHRLVLVGAWLAFTAALSVVLLMQLRQTNRTALQHAGLWATLASLGATIVVFAPALFVSACV